MKHIFRYAGHALVLMALALAGRAGPVPAANHALLVGVSSYPSLDKGLQLSGPANDVPLMRDVLLRRGFPAQNIRVLADRVKGAHGEPTRGAIMAEFKALADKAQKGDFVLLFFAGHGSQQPARDLGPRNPEPDGLDEIFLPRDIGKWDGNQAVQNAIVDDELGAAITAIRNRGAFVWAIFDTCHSGTITRGIEDNDVRYRDVKAADLGIPAPAIDKAAKQAAALFPRTRGGPEATPPMTALQNAKAAAGAGGFIAFYAAQSWERAPEQPMPADLSAGDPRKRQHGVFTYSIAESLAVNPTMTYQQLAEQILYRYRGQARQQPTPLFEGPSLDAMVFGTQAGSQILQWKLEPIDGGVRVPAGALHRLAEGATFSVVVNPGDPDKAVIGFLQAVKVELLYAMLAPVARDGKAAVDVAKLPAEAYARLVNPNSSFVLRVSLPPEVQSVGPGEAMAQSVVARLSKEKVDGMAVTWLPSREAGEIRLALRKGHLWFLPASAEIHEEEPNKTIAVSLAGKNERQVREAVIDTLRGVARATNLIKLASTAASTAVAQGVELRMSYERQGKSHDLKPSQVADLRSGDKLTLTVQNKLNKPVDLNVLFVDNRFGIQHMAAERFEPRGQRTLEVGTIDTKQTSGRESVLTIVTEGETQMMAANFSFLSQPTLPATRGGGSDDVRELLEAAGFAPERTRDLKRPDQALSKTGFRVFTWNAVGK